MSGGSTKLKANEKVHYVAQTTFCLDRRYSDLKAIGKGSYGVVCSALDSVSGKKIAIKKITPMAKHITDAKHVLREIRLMRHMGKHENIITMEDLVVRESSDELYIIMELLDTDLHRVIQSKQELTENHFKHFFFQLLCGVKYLHENRIIHRDLKPGNLLVTRDCRLRITDFGLARERPTGKGSDPDDMIDEPMTEHVVTRWFRPPELMLCPDGLYTYAVDMWSCGCILGEMLGRQPMFPGKNFVHQLQLIFEVIGSPQPSQVAHITNQQARKFLDSQSGKRKKPLQQLYKNASAAALAAIDGLLTFEPEDRMSVDEALATAFMRDLVGRGSPSEKYPPTSSSFEFEFERSSQIDKQQLVTLIQLEANSFRKEINKSSKGVSDDSVRTANGSTGHVAPHQPPQHHQNQEVHEKERASSRLKERSGSERERDVSAGRAGMAHRDRGNNDHSHQNERDRERQGERETTYPRKVSLPTHQHQPQQPPRKPAVPVFSQQNNASAVGIGGGGGREKQPVTAADRDGSDRHHRANDSDVSLGPQPSQQQRAGVMGVGTSTGAGRATTAVTGTAFEENVKATAANTTHVNAGIAVHLKGSWRYGAAMVPDTNNNNNNNNNSQRGADGTSSRNSNKDPVAEGKEREPADRRHESKHHRGGGNNNNNNNNNNDDNSDTEYDSLVGARARARLGQASSAGVGVGLADPDDYVRAQRRRTFDTAPVAGGSGSGMTGARGNNSPNPKSVSSGTAVGALLGVLAETNAVLQAKDLRSPPRYHLDNNAPTSNAMAGTSSSGAVRSPTAKGQGPADRPDFQRDRADLQSLLTTVTATAPTGTFTMMMTSPLRSPANQTHDPLPFPQSHHATTAAASPNLAASAVRQQAWGEQHSSSSSLLFAATSPTRQQQQPPKGVSADGVSATGIAHRDRVGSTAAATDYADYSNLSPSRVAASISGSTGANAVLSPTRSPLVYPKTRATSTTLASAMVAAGPAKPAGSTLSSEAAAALRMADDYLSSSNKRHQQQHQSSYHEESKGSDPSDPHTRRRRNTYNGSGYDEDYEHSDKAAYSDAANPPLPRDRERDLQRLQQQQQQQAEETTKKQQQQSQYHYHASVPNTTRRDIVDEDEPYANPTGARIRDRDLYGQAPALDKDKAEGGGAFAPVKKRQITMPKSPKFSKMSWQRKAEAGGVDNNNNNNGIAGGQQVKDKDKDRDYRERDREREKRKSFGAAVAPAPAAAAAAAPTGVMRPTTSWKMGYGGGPDAAVAAPTAKPRAASAGTAMMRQKEKERIERTAKYLDEDNDHDHGELDFVEEGLRQLRARRK